MEIDTPTRVGTGGVAVGVFTGVLVVVMAPLPTIVWLPLLSVSGLAALWGFVPVFRSVFPFGGEDSLHQPNDLRDAATETVPASSPRAIQRDVWVQDAIWRIYSGRWERRQFDANAAHEDIERLHDVLKEVRQAAADGLLPVWGKLGPVGTLWEPIPKGAWSSGNIDWFSFEQHCPEHLWMAGSIESGWDGPHGRGNWSELKTSKAQIDMLWPAHITPPPPAPSRIITCDAWLQDAVAFALYGHWPTEDETIFGQDDDLPKMGAIIEEMRSYAHDGQLQIWGRQTDLSLYVRIQPEFWVDNLINFETLWGPPETPRTESLEFHAPPPFKALKVSKAQMEALWSPH